MFVYKALNIFFLSFHSLLMLFNVFGWGYCVRTDWHWLVRQHLGYNHTPIPMSSSCCNNYWDSTSRPDWSIPAPPSYFS